MPNLPMWRTWLYVEGVHCREAGKPLIVGHSLSGSAESCPAWVHPPVAVPLGAQAPASLEHAVLAVLFNVNLQESGALKGGVFISHLRQISLIVPHIQGLPKKCIHTLTKENSTLYNRLL